MGIYSCDDCLYKGMLWVDDPCCHCNATGDKWVSDKPEDDD